MTQVVEQATTAVQSSGLSPMQLELLSRADAIFATIGSTVSKASDAAISAGQAVAAEVPDIAFQYIAFGRAYYTVLVVLGILGLVTCYFWLMRVGFCNSRNIADGYYKTWGTERLAYAFAGIVAGVVGSIVILVNIKDAILVWAAPKIWLILELVELIRRIKN